MAVYAICTECKTRRDQYRSNPKFCSDKSGHKRYVSWMADRTLGGRAGNTRVSETFPTEALALQQDRKWQVEWDEKRFVKPKQLDYRSFESVADEWWRMALAHNIIKATNRSELYRVNMFKSAFGKRDINSLTSNDATEHILARRELGRAIGTINREMKPLTWIMNYAVNQGYIPANPFLKIKPLKGANVHDRWMTLDELNRLFAAAADDQDLVDFIAVGVNTGFRLGNLIRLSAGDIINNRILARITKSGDPYDIAISHTIVPTLQRLVALRPVGPLLKTSHIGVRFRRAAKKAGLYRDKNEVQRVTIHTLRHTFAVLYLNRGGRIDDLSHLMGHANPAVTNAVYARFSRERKDAQAPLISTPVPERPQAESNRSLQIDNLLS